MTQTKVIEKKAEAVSTSQPEAGTVAPKQGDYTKFFYRNIERLWDAVESLQRENDALESKLKNASVVLNGGE